MDVGIVRNATFEADNQLEHLSTMREALFPKMAGAVSMLTRILIGKFPVRQNQPIRMHPVHQCGSQALTMVLIFGSPI